MNKNSIFDRELLKHNLNRFGKNFDQSDFLFREISDRLIENIAGFNQSFFDVLEINARNGELGKEIAQLKKSNRLVQTNFSAKFPLENQIIIDDEALNFPENSFDLVMNNLNLHFNNDVLAILTQNKKLLKDNGLYVCCFFGGASLKELREVFNKIELELYNGISPRIIPFIDIKTAGALAQRANFKNIICDSQTIEISYSSLLELLQDLRNMGLSNILFERNQRFISKKMLFLMEKLIRELYPSDSNGFVASFEIITITAFN